MYLRTVLRSWPVRRAMAATVSPCRARSRIMTSSPSVTTASSHDAGRHLGGRRAPGSGAGPSRRTEGVSVSASGGHSPSSYTGRPARLSRLPPGPGTPTDARPGARTGPFRRTRAEAAARAGRRARRVALYEEVRRRHAAGEKLLAIGRVMGLAVGTVRKYAYAESFPVPETRPLRSSILDPYLAHLQARLSGGGGKAPASCA